jgi:8-oxo-dGTP diphosphatase
MGSEKKIVRVGSAALIENSDGKFLIGKRSVWPKGMWVFPGGGVNFGETSEQAVVREVKEETGLDIKPVELIKVEEMIVPENEVHRIIFFYKAKVVGGTEKPSTDISEIKWLTSKEIIKLENLGHTVISIMKEANLIC